MATRVPYSMVPALPAHTQKKEEQRMEALAIAAVSTKSGSLWRSWPPANDDDTDQDLMFPACGSAEPYYCPERHAILQSPPISPCQQHDALQHCRLEVELEAESAVECSGSACVEMAHLHTNYRQDKI